MREDAVVHEAMARRDLVVSPTSLRRAVGEKAFGAKAGATGIHYGKL